MKQIFNNEKQLGPLTISLFFVLIFLRPCFSYCTGKIGLCVRDLLFSFAPFVHILFYLGAHDFFGEDVGILAGVTVISWLLRKTFLSFTIGNKKRRGVNQQNVILYQRALFPPPHQFALGIVRTREEKTTFFDLVNQAQNHIVRGW